MQVDCGCVSGGYVVSVIHHKCQCILDNLGSENFVSLRHPLNGYSGRVSNSVNRG